MIDKVLQTLNEKPRFSERVEHIETISARDAVYGKLEYPLPERISSYLSQKNIRLYTHQCEALNNIRSGKNIIITTPTASGKTLAFNVPVFERLEQRQSATALYLYPTKALSNDQLKSLQNLERLTDIDVSPGIYDGDTSSGKKAKIRESSRIVISNPYEMHHILPWSYKWERFFSNLQFVVIDEAHRYRGVLGSNVAYLIRRLRRICNCYGANPQFILSTATIANPVEFAEKLVGSSFSLIDNDGSPKGKKYFVFYNPFFNKIGTLSTHQETMDLFLEYLRNDLQSLCFTVSRKTAELISTWAKDKLKEKKPGIAQQICSYRAGYLPGERKKIEDDFKKGIIRGVTSTNALEMGIDIGSLDGVIISGYPGTSMSTWQQAGRAGRGAGESIVTLVAFQNPLDQYLMKHPDHFFSKPSEQAIVDLKNLYISSGHLLCAAAELPINLERDGGFLGDNAEAILKAFAKEHLVSNTNEGWVYSGKGRATEIVSLDGTSSEIFKVICDGKVIETMDRAQAYREGHKGAVILHQGETYVVEALDIINSFVHVRKVDVDYHTQALKRAEITILQQTESKQLGQFMLSYGSVEVTEQYHGYKIKKQDVVLGTQSLNLPSITFQTTGLWFTIPEYLAEKAWEQRKTDEDVIDSLARSGSKQVVKKDVFSGGLHGAEHAFIGVMPLHVMCDRWDIGGVSTPLHPETTKPTIFIYDGYEGGIGLAEKAYEIFIEIVQKTYDLVNDCSCESGCPGCIYSPKCGNNNTPLDKKATIFVLREILQQQTKTSINASNKVMKSSKG